ncbi:hypothetical protein LCGC14_1695800, partial [marine sediment metagenome]
DIVISNASQQLQEERRLFLKEYLGGKHLEKTNKKIDWRDFDINKDNYKITIEVE